MEAEQKRLDEARERRVYWQRWGPYLSERSWGTVREDYSADGSAWDYFPHDHARSRAYRWNEDGLAGFSDNRGMICFALALWNGQDPILKERLFGLTNEEGNHGEDVKECYYYLDATPTYSYFKCLYKYPQAEFPYRSLVEENSKRDKFQSEFELLDTGVFDENRYWDVFVEYAKADAEDLLIRIKVVNRGPEASTLHLLPTIWFRNRWTWGDEKDPRPLLYFIQEPNKPPAIELDHFKHGHRRLYFNGEAEPLFTENETNNERIFNTANATPFVKDAFDRYIVHGRHDAVNPALSGTKAAPYYRLTVEPGESAVIKLRFSVAASASGTELGPEFDKVFHDRRSEADEFYSGIIPSNLSIEGGRVMRQALAGLLWSKQFYHFSIRKWLDGDPLMPPPPPERRLGRNHEWPHLHNSEVISMPDKWEYPWYAAWDLAFHMIPLALVDSDSAKEQLILLLREWYMHPNGQLPAYEWAFGDVNPSVHAWAVWRVYRIEAVRQGAPDRLFLERAFHKLLLNFTWWVNMKDQEGNNIFEGGFLGLDNIGLFDRNKSLPNGGAIEQSDGTSWMAMFTLNMLAISLELASVDPAYEDVASKFFEHFMYIADAMNDEDKQGTTLWDEVDGFYYDRINLPSGEKIPIKVRSIVGLIPLFAVETATAEQINHFPGFRDRMNWFLANRPDIINSIASIERPGEKERRLISLVSPNRLRVILRYMLDENEFLSPYGIRSVSRFHKNNPFSMELDGVVNYVDYEPGDSTQGIFGGNSNWRGPIWFPVNFLIIEALQRFHYYFGDDFKIEFPTGSGNLLNLWDVAAELSRRLARLFLPDKNGRRPAFGENEKLQSDPHWRDHLLFYEYFHGDTGSGLGASHQTGWTALIAKLLQQNGE